MPYKNPEKAKENKRRYYLKYKDGWNENRKYSICIDCGKDCAITAKRCVTCYYKNKTKNPELHPKWNGGSSDGFILKMCKKIKTLDVCEKCGATENLVYHHNDGKRKNNSVENIKIVCGSCHARIHDRIKNIWRVEQ